MYNNNNTNNQYTSSSVVYNNNLDNKKNVPELTRHSESPESFEMPKTPSIHSTFDDTTHIRPILKQQESTLSTDNLLTSLKSAIRRIHPDELIRLQKQKQQKEQYHDRVIITRASTATTTTTTDNLTTHNNSNQLFSIPTIPDHHHHHRPRRQPSLCVPPDNNNNNNGRHLSENNKNTSVSSLTSQQTISSIALSAIPLTENSSYSLLNESCSNDNNHNDILLKGRLLCAIHMGWYSRRHFTTNETSNNNLRLRQSRLRWREFEAVLKKDRLELYLITNLVIKKHRLAHVIYLKPTNNNNKKRKKSSFYNPVKLTLVSPVDFIWSLEFRSCEDRHIHFLFVSRTIRESQTWYMALYRRPTLKTTPIPALIDVYIPALDNLQIRLPLINLDFKENNIRIQHVLHCALTLLDRQDIKPNDWHRDNVSLCWRFGKQNNNNSHLEWIPDDGYLLSPHLIEQTHTLELRPNTQRWRQYPGQQLPPPIMEGEFIFSNDQQKEQKRKKLYGMMEGHLLFLLEPLKVIKPPEDNLNEGVGGRHHTRLTWARSLFATQVLHVRSLTKLFRPTNASVTSTTRHAAHIEFHRRVTNIMNAFTVIDMSRVTKVRRVSNEQPTTFEITIDASSIKLQFKVSTMHNMFEWIQRIQKIIHQREHSTTFISQPFQEKSILYSGILYVRQDYLCTFKKLFCILTREKKLVLYNTCRYKDQVIWNDHFITLSLDQQVYVYNANDDQAITGSRRSELKTRQPPRIFHDGNTMSSCKTEDCTFVIWQTTQRHILVHLRERLSTFKLGHRLGRKGTVWVCLTRNQDEKEAWVCAIHQAMDQIS